jgi:hypothetical protein
MLCLECRQADYEKEQNGWFTYMFLLGTCYVIQYIVLFYLESFNVVKFTEIF